MHVSMTNNARDQRINTCSRVAMHLVAYNRDVAMADAIQASKLQTANDVAGATARHPRRDAGTPQTNNDRQDRRHWVLARLDRRLQGQRGGGFGGVGSVGA
jgi:hypothetical protein